MERFVWLIFIISTLIFLASLVSLNRVVSGDDVRTSGQSISSKSRTFITIIALVGLISSAALMVLEEIKQDLQTNLAESLTSVLNTSHEGISLWIREQKLRQLQQANHPTVVDATQMLYNAERRNQPLTDTAALQTLRDHFVIEQTLEQHVGFFIVDINGRNLASMRDTNIGTINPILSARPDLFLRAVGGEAVFVPPIPSDVPIAGQPNIRGKNVPASIFFASPIINDQGEVIGVLTKRYNPYDVFSYFFQLGHLGETGETYAFNANGDMISESRFYETLQAQGLLAADEGSILSLRLFENTGDGRPLKTHRLTRMAESALRGERSRNVEGYYDYRGEIVLGAWLWDHDNGFGITTEIDQIEGFAPYYKFRLMILVMVGLTSLLGIGYTLQVVRVSNRSTKLLQAASDELEGRVEERTQELAKNERLLQRIIDTVPAPLYLKDQQGCYQLINEEYTRVVGLTLEEVIGKSDIDLLPEEIAKSIVKTDERIVTSGEGDVSYETVPNPEGEDRAYLSYKEPVKDADGDIVGLVGVSLDVTDRLSTEKQLKESVDALNFVQYAVDDAEYMVIWGAIDTGQILYSNQTANRYLTGDDVLYPTQTLCELLQYPDKTDFAGFIDSLKDGFQKFELAMTTSTGEPLPVEVTAQLVLDGDVERLVIFGRDISMNKRLEQELIQARDKAEEANRAKSDFLASMSHEIRTPLNGVLGMIGLVRRTELTDKQDEQLLVAHKSAQTLLELINDLLDFSKIEANKLDIEELDFNVAEVLGDIAKSMAYRAEEKGLELILDIAGVENRIIKSDPTRVRQILLNLLSNAFKFTDRGDVILRAKLEEKDDRLWLTCAVKDSGIGIAPDVVPNLFQAFTQADASTTRKFGGTGLGLAICRRLCQLMNGDIQVTSEPGQGAEFSFTIEVKPSSHVITALPTESLQGLRVLVVDDSNTNRVIFRAELESWQLHVEEAGSAAIAWAMLDGTQGNYFDIALVDMNMAHMDGLQLVQKIRTDRRFEKLKILLMTSTTELGSPQELFDAGLNGYFAKPVTPTDLHNALQVVTIHGDQLQDAGTLVTTNFLHTLSRDKEPKDVAVNKDVRILLVEDNDINRMIVHGLLETEGLSCVDAENGQIALDYLSDPANHHQVDLILMDCQMPVLDGYTATERIRAGDAGDWATSLPIIAMTAHALQGDREKCLACGMNDYLTKPVNPDVFREILARYSHHSFAPPVTAQEQAEIIEAAIKWPDHVPALSDTRPEFAQFGAQYLRALKVMLSKGHGDIRAFNEDFASGTIEALRERAHGLKGSSATLGFLKVSHAAADIENTIRSGYSCTSLQVTKLVQEYERALVDMQAIIDLNTEDQSSGSGRDWREVIVEVESLLAESELVGDDLMGELEKLQAPHDLRKALSQLVDQLNNFEYDEALENCRELLAN